MNYKVFFVFMLVLLLDRVSNMQLRSESGNVVDDSGKQSSAVDISFIQDINDMIAKADHLTAEHHAAINEIQMKKKALFLQVNSSSQNVFHEDHGKGYRKEHTITGTVDGIAQGKPVTISIASRFSNNFESLETVTLTSENNKFKFVVKRGSYYLRFSGPHYEIPSAIKIAAPCKTQDCKFLNEQYKDIIRLRLFKGEDANVFKFEWTQPRSENVAIEAISAVNADLSNWDHAVELDSNLNDKNLDISGAAATIKTIYGIHLMGTWGSEYAERLLNVLSTFPKMIRMELYHKQIRDTQRKPQKWILVNEDLGPTGIEIQVSDESDKEYSKTVLVSKNAFSFSRKLLANKTVSDRKYFSRKLDKIIIRTLLADNYQLMEAYFLDKHDVLLIHPEYHFHKIPGLTGYDHTHYQSWAKNKEELIELATSWDEYPTKFQKIPGLKYLLRRADGTKHPVYPDAPAVAFPSGPQNESFIEFMETAFVNYYNVSHLILHEIGHFIHVNIISEDLKKNWIQLGQWFPEPLAPSKWATRLETQFVSGYAHDKTPEEDFAESIASFVLNPVLLQTRAKAKYDWIKLNVFDKAHYVAASSRTFDVINLGPENFNFPGKVEKIVATVTGSPSGDKDVSVVISLMTDKNKSKEGCAIRAHAIFFSEQYVKKEIYFFPVDGSGCSHQLKADFKFGRTETRGRWIAESIRFTGPNEIQRYTGLGSFVVYLYVNNALEDVEEPIILSKSIQLSTYDSRSENEKSLIKYSVLVLEDKMLKARGGSYAAFASSATSSYSYDAFNNFSYPELTDERYLTQDNFYRDLKTAGFRKVPQSACQRVADETISALNCFQIVGSVEIPRYCVAEEPYYLKHMLVRDEAGNQGSINFYDKTHSVRLRTFADRDVSKPVISNTRVSSRPANAQQDGETIVTVSFDLYENKSGILFVSILLRDPNGTTHTSSVDRYLFEGFANGRKQVTHQIHLPRGSAAGTWMLDEIKASDNCRNETRNVYTYSVYVSNTQ